jgi:hypothetical protein
MIEERVALRGEHANVSKRFAQHEQYSKDILGSLTTIKNSLDKYIDFSKTRGVSKEYKEVVESNFKKIEDAIESAVKQYRPGRIGSLFGQIRLMLEYYAGITVYEDFLRSKSLDRDSFNSGDWVNAIDFTFEDSGWGKGLPIAEKNEDKWPTMAPLLANPDLDPSRWLMAKSSIYFRELLRIRYSSSLYRLRDKQSVIDNMTFLNTGITQTSGLIVMHLKDEESRRHKEQE